MEFYFPTEFGEQVAFASAVVTAILGLVVMFAPGLSLSFFGLQPRDGRVEGLAEVRSAGGAYVGFAGTALLLAQPTVYLALGAALVMAAFARILSILSDRGNTLRNILFLVVQLILAALPLSYVFGII